MIIFFFTILVHFANIHPQEPTIVFNAEPSLIHVGEESVLTGKITNGERAFISPLGKVDVEGQITVTPDNTQSYTLITEGKGGIAAQTITVEVQGGKGEFLSRRFFKYPLHYQFQEMAMYDIIVHIHNVLQNQLHFTVDVSQDFLTKNFRIITNKLETGLFEEQDKTIGARRVAYFIEVLKSSPISNKVNFTIESFVEYRKRIERTWRTEREESKYHEAGRELRRLIFESQE